MGQNETDTIYVREGHGEEEEEEMTEWDRMNEDVLAKRIRYLDGRVNSNNRLKKKRKDIKSTLGSLNSMGKKKMAFDPKQNNSVG